MIKKISTFFEKYWNHFVLIKNSPYISFADKFKAFRILNILFVKSKIYPNPKKEITYKIFKYKVSAYSYATLFYLFKEIFLSKEYYFESDESDLIILDCGANIGMSVLYFKSIYPKSSIIAFEPNPHAFALLKKNIEQNNIEGVTLKNAGLSDKMDDIEFFISENKESLTGSLIQGRGGDNTIKIKTEKLSDYLKGNAIDLVKMDIEGAEIEVFRELKESNVIQNSKRYIIEYHHLINNAKANLSEFLLPFEEFNFQYNIRTTFEEIGDFQDILINAYKEN